MKGPLLPIQKYHDKVMTWSQILLRVNLYVLVACIGLFAVSFGILTSSLGVAPAEDTMLLATFLTVTLRGIQLLPFVHLLLILLQLPAVRRSTRRVYLMLAVSTIALCYLETTRIAIVHNMIVNNIDNQIEPYQAFGPGIVYVPILVGLNVALVVCTLRFLRQTKAGTPAKPNPAIERTM